MPGADPPWLAPPPATVPEWTERAAHPYKTRLAPAAENEFQSWVRVAGVPFDDSHTSDYDMRGYWLAKKNGDPEAQTEINAADHLPHFPDTYKTPYHRTFSSDSKYAQPGAPTWEGELLIDRHGRIIADERPPGR